MGETGQGKTTFLHALLRKYAADVSIGSPEVPLGEKTIKIARVGTFLLSTDAGDEVVSIILSLIDH